MAAASAYASPSVVGGFGSTSPSVVSDYCSYGVDSMKGGYIRSDPIALQPPRDPTGGSRIPCPGQALPVPSCDSADIPQNYQIPPSCDSSPPLQSFFPSTTPNEGLSPRFNDISPPAQPLESQQVFLQSQTPPPSAQFPRPTNGEISIYDSPPGPVISVGDMTPSSLHELSPSLQKFSPSHAQMQCATEGCSYPPSARDVHTTTPLRNENFTFAPDRVDVSPDTPKEGGIIHRLSFSNDFRTPASSRSSVVQFSSRPSSSHKIGTGYLIPGSFSMVRFATRGNISPGAPATPTKHFSFSSTEPSRTSENPSSAGMSSHASASAESASDVYAFQPLPSNAAGSSAYSSAAAASTEAAPHISPPTPRTTAAATAALPPTILPSTLTSRAHNGPFPTSPETFFGDTLPFFANSCSSASAAPSPGFFAAADIPDAAAGRPPPAYTRFFSPVASLPQHNSGDEGYLPSFNTSSKKHSFDMPAARDFNSFLCESSSSSHGAGRNRFQKRMSDDGQFFSSSFATGKEDHNNTPLRGKTRTQELLLSSLDISPAAVADGGAAVPAAASPHLHTEIDDGSAAPKPAAVADKAAAGEEASVADEASAADAAAAAAFFSPKKENFRSFPLLRRSTSFTSVTNATQQRNQRGIDMTDVYATASGNHHEERQMKIANANMISPDMHWSRSPELSALSPALYPHLPPRGEIKSEAEKSKFFFPETLTSKNTAEGQEKYTPPWSRKKTGNSRFPTLPFFADLCNDSSAGAASGRESCKNTSILPEHASTGREPVPEGDVHWFTRREKMCSKEAMNTNISNRDALSRSECLLYGKSTDEAALGCKSLVRIETSNKVSQPRTTGENRFFPGVHTPGDIVEETKTCMHQQGENVLLSSALLKDVQKDKSAVPLSSGEKLQQLKQRNPLYSLGKEKTPIQQTDIPLSSESISGNYHRYLQGVISRSSYPPSSSSSSSSLSPSMCLPHPRCPSHCAAVAAASVLTPHPHTSSNIILSLQQHKQHKQENEKEEIISIPVEDNNKKKDKEEVYILGGMRQSAALLPIFAVDGEMITHGRKYGGEQPAALRSLKETQEKAATEKGMFNTDISIPSDEEGKEISLQRSEPQDLASWKSVYQQVTGENKILRRRMQEAESQIFSLQQNLNKETARATAQTKQQLNLDAALQAARTELLRLRHTLRLHLRGLDLPAGAIIGGAADVRREVLLMRQALQEGVEYNAELMEQNESLRIRLSELENCISAVTHSNENDISHNDKEKKREEELREWHFLFNQLQATSGIRTGDPTPANMESLLEELHQRQYTPLRQHRHLKDIFARARQCSTAHPPSAVNGIVSSPPHQITHDILATGEKNPITMPGNYSPDSAHVADTTGTSANNGDTSADSGLPSHHQEKQKTLPISPGYTCTAQNQYSTPGRGGYKSYFPANPESDSKTSHGNVADNTPHKQSSSSSKFADVGCTRDEYQGHNSPLLSALNGTKGINPIINGRNVVSAVAEDTTSPGQPAAAPRLPPQTQTVKTDLVERL